MATVDTNSPTMELNNLNLPNALRARITKVYDSPDSTTSDTLNETSCTANVKNKPFILYLPTVVLRKKHNPAFSLACHLANHHSIPLIVLAVVLDDTHHNDNVNSDNPMKNVVMTSRKLSFQLEALQYVSKKWEDHGAGVAIRVHGNGARIPHHLTLARRALAVVTDEPFVNPYVSFVQSVERVNHNTYRVDGSCSIPPNSHLDRRFDTEGKIKSCKGLPNKAWKWEKMTYKTRKIHIHDAVLIGSLDAPKLKNQLEPNFFLEEVYCDSLPLPSEWKDAMTSCPDRRPWTVEELSSIDNLKDWSMNSWTSDTSVPPCAQTCGSYPAAKQRWDTFLESHLNGYARNRNNIQKPHSVSRLSCYLNYGILSIFQVLHDVEQHRSSPGSNKSSIDKFKEEIIKWREMSYAHAFSTEIYDKVAVLPSWSRTYLQQCCNRNSLSRKLSLEELEEGTTHDTTWNAMQQYLVTTGELHNNARMTWGKTLLHWLTMHHSPEDLLRYMCYLNDRYALDGLSPPSYAGILWCLGWGDKPTSSGGISEKSTSRYRAGSEGFQIAQSLLLDIKYEGTNKKDYKKQKIEEASNDRKDDQKTILSYFSSLKPKDESIVG